MRSNVVRTSCCTRVAQAMVPKLILNSGADKSVRTESQKAALSSRSGRGAGSLELLSGSYRSGCRCVRIDQILLVQKTYRSRSSDLRRLQRLAGSTRGC
jgi:hypothetical protein